MKIALIGNGAIAGYVKEKLAGRGVELAALLLRPERVAAAPAPKPGAPRLIASVADMPEGVRLVVDCAGHAGLMSYGPDVLRAGYDLVTVSIGALAEQALHDELVAAARAGGAKLHLASGAIGALDCLRAARVGELHSVRYIGRKPPRGWVGSPAETRIDLDALGGEARTHFTGSARRAAIEYPKNANVAAAVALAGLGFDETEVELIADPTVVANIHEVRAAGAFGEFHFRISGRPLPDNPRTSALAAMSAVAAILNQTDPIVF